MNDRDYQVFRAAVRKASSFAVWPFIVALLPIIWQIVQLIIANRAERFGAISAFEAVRGEASRAERRAQAAWHEAEREVPWP